MDLCHSAAFVCEGLRLLWLYWLWVKEQMHTRTVWRRTLTEMRLFFGTYLHLFTFSPIQLRLPYPNIEIYTKQCKMQYKLFVTLRDSATIMAYNIRLPSVVFERAGTRLTLITTFNYYRMKKKKNCLLAIYSVFYSSFFFCQLYLFACRLHSMNDLF